MLQERLSPCETLLYHWLHFHQDQPETLNLGNFQVWTAEFLTEAATGEDIDRALLRLMELQLIYLDSAGNVAITSEEQPRVKLAPLPRKLWQSWSWEQYLAMGSLAIFSAILMGFSIFTLWTNRASNPEMTEISTRVEQVQE